MERKLAETCEKADADLQNILIDCVEGGLLGRFAPLRPLERARILASGC